MSLIRTITLMGVLLFAVIAVPQQAFSQVKRMVLIEEATNASCPPCASQNPTFQAYLLNPDHQGRFVTIVYHASWPGADVMYSANTSMNSSRTSYYNITGVPTCVVNGTEKESPSDTAIVNAHVSADEGTSPIEITIDQTANGDNVTASVTVASSEAISNATLRIVVVEGYHYYAAAGGNGEKDFYFIAREMLPDNNGTTIALDADSSMNVTADFTMDAEWNSNEIYVVAFVQDNSTKEVLQAAQNRPFLEFSGSEPLSAYEKTDNTPHTFRRTLEAPVTGTYGYTVTETLPEGWTFSINADGAPWDSVSVPTFTKGSSVDISVTVTPNGSLKRYGAVNLEIRGPYGSSTTVSFTFYNTPIDVLMFRRDEGNDKITEYYAKGFDLAGNWSYAIVNDGDDTMFDPQEHSIFAIESGKWILDSSDVAMIQNYMDQGGRIWIAGGEIAWALADPSATNNDPDVYQNEEFVHNYLHVDYIADDPDPTDLHSVRGFAGDVIGDNVNFAIYQGVKNMDTPDVIRPRDGAVACFYYGTNQDDIAGIHYVGNNYALVYYGFGMGSTSTPSWLESVFTRTLEWLSTVNSTESIPEVPQGCTVSAFPNPVTEMARIPITLDRSQDISVVLYNVYGQRIASIFEGNAQAGINTYQYNASGLPAGTYYIRVHAGTAVTSTTMQVLR